MDDTKINVLRQTQEQLAAKLLNRPGVSYVEYIVTVGDKNATSGWACYWTGDETYTFSDEDSSNEPNGHWRGTVTCHLSATFDRERLEQLARL